MSYRITDALRDLLEKFADLYRCEQGKRISADSGDRSVPIMTEHPNRWVGGNPDKMNIPKPAHTTLTYLQAHLLAESQPY